MANLLLERTAPTAPTASLPVFSKMSHAPSKGKGIASSLRALIVSVEKKATVHYTSHLRKHAEAQGWPSNIVSQLSILYTEGSGHQISYPEAIKDDVLTLEYGTQSVPPSPALRSYMWGNN